MQRLHALVSETVGPQLPWSATFVTSLGRKKGIVQTAM
jgi:hypothetical protein